MADEPLDPILIQVTVPLPAPMIFGALTDAEKVQAWLAPRARVDPTVGGVYELEFDDDPSWVSAGRVTHFTADTDIGFGWQTPPLYADGVGPGPSSVYFRLQESPEGIDVTLEHGSWLPTPAGEEARSFHFHFWDERLRRFKEYLLKAAYG